jgi:hypothetical protein
VPTDFRFLVRGLQIKSSSSSTIAVYYDRETSEQPNVSFLHASGFLNAVSVLRAAGARCQSGVFTRGDDATAALMSAVRNKLVGDEMDSNDDDDNKRNGFSASGVRRAGGEVGLHASDILNDEIGSKLTSVYYSRQCCHARRCQQAYGNRHRRRRSLNGERRGTGTQGELTKLPTGAVAASNSCVRPPAPVLLATILRQLSSAWHTARHHATLRTLTDAAQASALSPPHLLSKSGVE